MYSSSVRFGSIICSGVMNHAQSQFLEQNAGAITGTQIPNLCDRLKGVGDATQVKSLV